MHPDTIGALAILAIALAITGWGLRLWIIECFLAPEPSNERRRSSVRLVSDKYGSVGERS